MTVLAIACAGLILAWNIAQTIRLYKVKHELARVRQAQARALEQIIREQRRGA